MASYFDLQPGASTNVKQADLPGEAKEYGNMSMLTPQVTRILDEIGDDHSSSDEDELNVSEDNDPSDTKEVCHHGRNKSKDNLHKLQLSPQHESPGLASPTPGLRGGSRHPHLARFHSLRSILFSTRIEEAHAKHREQMEQEQAEQKWREEHEQRKGLNRPKTPESPKGSPKGSPTKEGFMHRMGSKLKRMTSKESALPTIEDENNESTASSDDEGNMGKRRARNDLDAGSLNEGHLEDLVRWVSRRDPPSDGEARRGRRSAIEDRNMRGSLKQSDVEDLVQFASQKEDLKSEHREEEVALDWSDAATESDSESGERDDDRSFGNKDVDELVRWVSRKDGDKAGPIPTKKQDQKQSSSSSKVNESDAAEPVHWIMEADETNGNSERVKNFKDQSSTMQQEIKLRPEQPDGIGRSQEDKGSLDDADLDELVQYVSRKDQPIAQDRSKKANSKNDEDAQKSLPTTHSPTPPAKQVQQRVPTPQTSTQPISKVTNSLSMPPDHMKGIDEPDSIRHSQNTDSVPDGNVDDIVNWVPKRDTAQQEGKRDDEIFKWEKEEDEPRMIQSDERSIGPEDVDELVKWAAKK
ncbi:hypothetical protein CC78DRAFT_618334 [Lojkania enalia]|uniref:Uncharacterized protein n=1 Tax=Lojkania enalia TaxID=147567 RepID=A0A9P4KB15_9PLEO|nr:hypothetical protein CC78DRAFT_618334 [Didymosphaeria enalia]